MFNGLGALYSKEQVKVVSQLETDCDQTKGAQAAQSMLTANPGLKVIYSACGPPAVGAIQSIKNAGIKPADMTLVGFDASPDEVDGHQGRRRDRQRRAVPGKDRIARYRDALQGGAGQEGAEERRYRHGSRHGGQRLAVRIVSTGPSAHCAPRGRSSRKESRRRDRRRTSAFLEPRAGGAAVDHGGARRDRSRVRARRPAAAARARRRRRHRARAGDLQRRRHGRHVRARARRTRGSAR